ncbi:MAG: MCE family protein [Aquificae bacterium]|nr:MCE family protein [Aquificota bacterium]
MNSKLAFKVGLFVLLVSAIAGYLIIMFNGKGFGVDTKEYYIYFDSVEGLSPGADVQVKGVKAGKVNSISIENGKVRVDISIREDITLYKNARAYIKTLGLMGDKFVYIDPGTPDAGELLSGNPIPQAQVYASTEDVMASVSSAAEKLAQFIDNLNTAVEKGNLEELIVNIRQLAKHTDELVQENRKAIKETIENIRVLSLSLRKDLPILIAKLEKAADNIGTIAGENRKDIRLLIANLREVSKALKEKTPQVLENMNKAVSVIGETVDENKDEISKTIKHLEKSAEKFEKILAYIEEGKGTIGKLIKEDKLYEEVRGGIKSFTKPFALVEKSTLDIMLYGEKHTGNTDAKAGMAAMFSSKPDRYIYIGLLSNSNGSITKKDIYISGDQVTTQIKKDYNILFDIQYARKFLTWHDKEFWVRAGIKDTTADAGIDIKYSKNLWFTSDLYNFDRDEVPGEPKNPQLDIGFRYRFEKYPFFIKAGGSDLLNSQYRGIYIGGGFVFRDDDLKYLLGAMPRP